MNKRTREYIAQVQTCQVTVGLTLLMIKRGDARQRKSSGRSTAAGSSTA
jgi:hypothetical protein